MAAHDMTDLWVDTDFGFDDLWALLLLKRFGCPIAGVSLVAGNAPLAQVAVNAAGAAQAYGLTAPIRRGAARPRRRRPETADRTLGPRGMRSRGRHLPALPTTAILDGAVDALATWLLAGPADGARTVLALGPLTNIAALIEQKPVAAARVTHLVWMGGSDGPGNHTPQAEFNAFADPEAAALVAAAGVPLTVIDLMLCRKVTFGADDWPEMDALTADLLGGYLDIALERGRARMAIYDPVAALAAVAPGHFDFADRTLHVCTDPADGYGATVFSEGGTGRTRLAVGLRSDVARICLETLTRDDTHGG